MNNNLNLQKVTVMDSKANTRAFQRAKDFFEKEYKDRGMVKWQGFFLSDHVEDVEKYANEREQVEQQEQMPSMTLEEISEVLFDAYRKLETIEYQLKGVDVLGHYPPIKKGKVKGNDENVAVIGNKRVDISQINWCQII
ncbi:hypothetical protein IV50_GL001178 [Weissella viridescens]|uniref:Uncharacterized protein n=2 Tax=Weissella viridescens TaxID=1629 RepID=A0A0R2H6N1_WEIVI|nr:hypothetical protein IV50_GL001178 [Weissella viridescens]